MINFIYKAQALTFTDSSITSMLDSLAEFHRFKHSVIDAGLRRGASGPINRFDIPKLELFHSFTRAAQGVGAPIQFTADVSECLLITHCKNPFKCTSHQQSTFAKQIVHLLDREEHMRQFQFLMLLVECGTALKNIVDKEFDEMSDVDPTLAWILRVSPDDHATFSPQDRPIRNYFIKGIVADDARVTAHVTIVLNHKMQSLVWVSSTYWLPLFHSALSHFVSSLSLQTLPTDMVNVWNMFRLQLLSQLHGMKIMPSQLLQALPLSEEFPFGKCDTVLLHSPDVEHKS